MSTNFLKTFFIHKTLKLGVGKEVRRRKGTGLIPDTLFVFLRGERHKNDFKMKSEGVRLGRFDRTIRCKLGRACLSPGANQVETGDCRSFFENLYFSGFQSFQGVGIYEGCKRGQSCIKRPVFAKF